MRINKAAGFALAGMLVAGMQACTSNRDDMAYGPAATVGLSLQPSSREMMAGEIVTVIANTENLLGRDSEIEWNAPGGEVRTEENGRIARVMYDQPGTYTISAQLFVDGTMVRRDGVTVNVKPLR